MILYRADIVSREQNTVKILICVVLSNKDDISGVLLSVFWRLSRWLMFAWNVSTFISCELLYMNFVRDPLKFYVLPVYNKDICLTMCFWVFRQRDLWSLLLLMLSIFLHSCSLPSNLPSSSILEKLKGSLRLSESIQTHLLFQNSIFLLFQISIACSDALVHGLRSSSPVLGLSLVPLQIWICSKIRWLGDRLKSWTMSKCFRHCPT